MSELNSLERIFLVLPDFNTHMQVKLTFVLSSTKNPQSKLQYPYVGEINDNLEKVLCV